jgi:hypothetical protein
MRGVTGSLSPTVRFEIADREHPVMAIRQKTDRTCFLTNGRMGFLRFDRPGITGVMPSWRVPIISRF